jgi:uncharacterized protein DUF6585
MANGSGGLGHLIREFHRPLAEGAAVWLTIAVFMAIASGLSAAEQPGIVAWLLSPVLLAGTAVILYAMFIRGRVSIWVHARGVAVQRGHEISAALWSAVERVYYEESIGPVFHLVLHVGRERIALTSRLEAMRPALEEIVSRSMSIISVRCAADFHSGLDVDFGPLHLSKRRLAVKRHRAVSVLPLERIGRFELRGGRLRVEEKGSEPRLFCDVPLAEIANLGALHALLSWAVSRGTPRQGMSARPRSAMD